MSTQSFHESFYCLRKALAIDTPVDPSCVVENIMLDVSRRFVNFLFQIIYCEAFVENFPSISMPMSPTFYFNLYFITVLSEISNWTLNQIVMIGILLNIRKCFVGVTMVTIFPAVLFLRQPKQTRWRLTNWTMKICDTGIVNGSYERID